MAYFSTESAESAINEITNYMGKAIEHCETMAQAGKNCEDNMTNDETAKAANARLSSSLGAFQMNINLMSNVVKGIQKELEHYREIERARSSL